MAESERDVATWGHWCYEQEPTELSVTMPRCPQCGALNLNRAAS